MHNLHIQWIAITAKGETPEGLLSLGKLLRAKITCKVGEPREVEIPEEGHGFVIDAYIPKNSMTWREITRVVTAIYPIYEYEIS